MKLDVKELIDKLLTRPTADELKTVSSGLSATTYTLSGNISDYDLINIVALTSYSNRFEITIPTSVFSSSTSQIYYAALGTEYNVYHLAVKYTSDTSITVQAKGTGVNGMIVTGIKL